MFNRQKKTQHQLKCTKQSHSSLETDKNASAEKKKKIFPEEIVVVVYKTYWNSTALSKIIATASVSLIADISVMYCIVLFNATTTTS